MHETYNETLKESYLKNYVIMPTKSISCVETFNAPSLYDPDYLKLLLIGEIM